MKNLSVMGKKRKTDIVNKLAEILIVMDSADIRAYEMQFLIDTTVDICELIEKDEAKQELLKIVEEKHVGNSR